MSHHVFDLVSEFLVHSLFELDAVDWAALVHDNVFAIVSVVEDKFELCKVGAVHKLVVVLLAEESFLESSECSLRISIVEIEV